VTASIEEKTAARPWQLSAEALALWQRFPPRTVPASWPATRQASGKVAARFVRNVHNRASCGEARWRTGGSGL
jgi:hypothetical protein